MKKHAFMSIFVVGHQRIILAGVLPIQGGFAVTWAVIYDCLSASEVTLRDMGKIN